jgi:hypothetical protein
LTGSARALQFTLGDSSASFRVFLRQKKRPALPCCAQRKTFEAYHLEGSSLQQGLSGTCCIVGSVLRRAACLSELAIAFSRRQPGFGFSGQNPDCSRQKLYATSVPKAKIGGVFLPKQQAAPRKPSVSSNLQRIHPKNQAPFFFATAAGTQIL